METARKYFLALRLGQSASWRELYDRYQGGACDLPESLVLLHPMWLEGTGFEPPSRRSRRFTIGASPSDTCASRLLWGYDCPTGFSELQVDHRFPFSLGGPTLPENASYLCGTHNYAKAHDIHVLPWEDPDIYFSWVAAEIECRAPYLLVSRA
jgi:hypothetical protein